MKEVIVQISKQMESLTKIYAEKPAVAIGLYLLTLFLIWFLPGFLSQELFGGVDPCPSVILEYGGIYLLTAVLFGMSSLILFTLVVNKSRAIISFFTAALFIILLLFSGLTGTGKITTSFYIGGLESFLASSCEVIISALITFLATALLSMSVIIPLLMINRYITIKRPNVTLFFIGTILFPFLVTGVFTDNYIHAGSQWISLIVSISGAFLSGLAGTAVISIPLVVLSLMRESGTNDKRRDVFNFGLFFACIFLIWFVPGFLEPGFFISGSQSNAMAGSSTLIYISFMLRYAGIIILMPVLFGCSAALLYKSINTGEELLKRDTGYITGIFAGALILLSMIPAFSVPEKNLNLPFYIYGWSNFGLHPLADTVLSLMAFIPELSIAALGVIMPFIVLKKKLPLKRTISAIIIAGILTFPALVILIYGNGTQMTSWAWLSLIVTELYGFCLAAAGALIIYALYVLAERIAAL